MDNVFCTLVWSKLKSLYVSFLISWYDRIHWWSPHDLDHILTWFSNYIVYLLNDFVGGCDRFRNCYIAQRIPYSQYFIVCCKVCMYYCFFNSLWDSAVNLLFIVWHANILINNFNINVNRNNIKYKYKSILEHISHTIEILLYINV